MISFSPAIPSRKDYDWCWFLRRQGPAGDAMERVLHDIGVMDHSGWADWQPSTLTGTGAPTHVTFSLGSTALCVTTEVDDPATAPAARLEKACKIMVDLGGTAPGAAMRDVIAAAQCAGSLTYGARLGIRQSGTLRSTRLLVELPAAAADLGALMMPRVCAGLAKIGGAAVSLTMLDHDGESGALTLYGKIGGATRHHLPLLADIAEVSPDLLAMAIDGLAETTGRDALPVRDLGFSFADKGPGHPPALSLYLSAQETFGCDIAITRRIMACGGDRLNGYDMLMDHLPAAPAQGATHHGHIGMTACTGAMPVLSVSVAAPWTHPAAA